ncbi:MAG: hypothetical protein HN548_10130 [Opitutae bacterium]|jgi:glutaredoxin 3|nr:hypothetical protein [Opitutae bacterium]MBT5717441.1 hypothetical protein [Opitutae bacterium]
MSLPILYIKQGCPWCIDALEYFKQVDLKLEVVDVIQNPSRMSDLIECSSQNKTPTLKNEDFIVKDFDVQEFKQAMLENPTEAKKLGL